MVLSTTVYVSGQTVADIIARPYAPGVSYLKLKEPAVMSAPALSAPKMRILYSDDNPDSRELLCLILAREGFETTCPETSEQVLKAAKEDEFDAYILDNWMPGISG